MGDCSRLCDACVSPSFVAQLGVRPCDFVRFTAGQGCSVFSKTSISEVTWKFFVHLGRGTIRALCAAQGANIAAARVTARNFVRWAKVEIAPRGEQVLLSAGLQLAALGVEHAAHAWRSGCGCQCALLSRSFEVHIDGGDRGGSALACDALCTADRAALAAGAAAKAKWGLVAPSSWIHVASKRAPREACSLGTALGTALPMPLPEPAAAADLTSALLFNLLSPFAPRVTRPPSALLAPQILLLGSVGSGKSSLVSQCCARLSLPLLRFAAFDLARMSCSQPAEVLRNAVTQSQCYRPVVIVLDDLNEIAPESLLRARCTTAASPGLATIHALLNRVRACRLYHRKILRERAVVIGTCQAGQAMHPSLLACFDLVLRLRPPSAAKRLALVQYFCRDLGLAIPDGPTAGLLVAQMDGFAAADVGAVCVEAELLATRSRFQKGGTMVESHGSCGAQDVRPQPKQASAGDWALAASCVRPSGLLDLITQAADARCERSIICGQWQAKRRLGRLLLWPMRAPAFAAAMGICAPRGVLLCGPPGTGKTLLVRVLAAGSALNLLSVAIPLIIAPGGRGGENAIASLFERARANAPCLLFFDDLQALFGTRASLGMTGHGMLSQLLIEMDVYSDSCTRPNDVRGTSLVAGTLAVAATATVNVALAHPATIYPLVSAGTLPFLAIIGATNVPGGLDSALLRPGRLEHTLYLSVPSHAARRSILTRRLEDMSLCDVQCTYAEELTQRTLGFSGADLMLLCQKATLGALQRQSVRHPPPHEPVCMRSTEMYRASSATAACTAVCGLQLTVSGADFECALRQVNPTATSWFARRLEARVVAASVGS